MLFRKIIPIYRETHKKVGKDKRFFLHQGFWDPQILLLNGYLASFPGVKRRRREANHLPQSRAKDKNEWTCNSTTPPTSNMAPLCALHCVG
jgi:hypothetical protein